jgi:uncharacterized protein
MIAKLAPWPWGAAAWLLFSPLLATGQLHPELRTIFTSGEAMINVVPDEVILQLGVETYAPTLPGAKTANEQSASRLLAAIKNMDIEEKHVQTDVLQVEIVYHPSGIRQGIDGYMARRGYLITLKKPEDFERVVDTALMNGANALMGFEFRTTELRRHRDEARRLAIRAAREKAVALAAELGCTIGPARTINEQGGSYSYWGARWGGWGAWGRHGHGMAQNVVQDFAGDGILAGGEALPFGQIGIRAQVSVTFDLAPSD